MKLKINTRKFIIIMVCLIALGILGWYLYEDANKGEYISYKSFVEKVEAGEVEAVTIAEDKLTFKIKDDNSDYRTDNPEYDNFKEELLLKGIEVETEASAEDTISLFLDILVDIVFFGALIFAAVRFKTSFSGNFKVVRNTKVGFDDIAGMHNVKNDMQYVVDILKNPGKYRKQGIRPNKGVILEGPPGNGKTMFAKALAKEANVNFIAAKGADFQSAVMAVGPGKVKSLFKKASKNKPCIIFIDEFDGIGEARSYGGAGIDKENNRMIITMLNEMDGFENSDGVMVIAATNSYKSLDEALVRPGRFDITYHIGNPDKETRRELISIYTKGKKLSEDINVEEMVDLFDGISCASIETIINEAAMEAIRKSRDVIDRACVKMAYEKIRNL